jgi:hypothetical protein
MESISIQNKRVCISRYGDLSKLNIQTPNEQRIVDQLKTVDIVTYQLSCLKQTGSCNFLGVINIHFCEEDQTYYLVDGQHRMSAIKLLFNEHAHDPEFFVELVNVQTRDELKQNYNIINKNTPLPEFPDMIDKNIPENASVYFQNKYPDVWSLSSRAHRPMIFFNFFQETLGIILEHIPNTTDSKLIEYIEQYNDDVLSKLPFTSFQGVTEKMWCKAKEYGFYYGLFAYCSNDKFGYGWSKRMIEHYTNTKLVGTKITRKQKIPKKVKDDSWDLHIGSSVGEAYCIVCNTTKINSKSFDAGHVVSEHNGGNTDINNIMPICHSCNLSMSTVNMDIYINTNYPNNVLNFNKRKYTLTTAPIEAQANKQKSNTKKFLSLFSSSDKKN